MFSIFLLISSSSRLFSRLFGTVPRAPNTTVFITSLYQNFINSQKNSKYLSNCSPSFKRSGTLCHLLKFTRWEVIFFLLIIRSGLLALIRWSICISKSQGILCVSFSRTLLLLYSLRILISSLTEDHSLEFEWQQVCSNLQDFSVFWPISVL